MISTRLSLFFLSLLVTMALVSGCARFGQRKPSIVIPEMDSPQEQFTVAREQERRARGTFERKNRTEEFEKSIAAYASVEKRFPKDLEYTPLAIVQTGELQFELEEYDRALRNFERAASAYPGQDDIRAAGLWGQGRCYEKLDRKDLAQQCYKLIVDEFGSSTDARLRALVSEARTRYRMVR